MLEIETHKLQKAIFLIGDDGQMEKMLYRISESKNAVIHSCVDVLSGIAQSVSVEPYLILLNLCSCGANSSAVVEALRFASPGSKIIGYGEAWTEVYYSGLEKLGMDELIIMPAPIHEIKNIVFDGSISYNRFQSENGPHLEVDREDISAIVTMFSSMVNGNFMETCRDLSLAVADGPYELCRKGEQKLTEFLQVRNIKIYNDLRDSAADTSEFGIIDYFDVSLNSLNGGSFGIMRIWPGNAKPDIELVNSIAGFMSALLELAWRDHNLKSLATVDELTGAYNRRYFESFLRQLLERAESEEIKIAVLVFDIDNFKYFNDTYGHIAGDNILYQATELARKCCRKHDVVARLGGDEFAILFWDSPDIPRDTIVDEKPGDTMPGHMEMVMRLSDNFRKQMRDSSCASRYGNHVSKLTISGGVATYPEDGTTVRKLLISADTALLKAKGEGKDQINSVQ